MAGDVDKASSYKLTRLEQLAVQGVQAREREIQVTMLAPLQSDFNEVLVSITSRLGLEADAFGKTHRLDLDTFSVVAAPPPSDKPEDLPRSEIANPGQDNGNIDLPTTERWREQEPFATQSGNRRRN